MSGGSSSWWWKRFGLRLTRRDEVTRRRLILAATAAAALIALPAAWYYGSPWWTLWRMREAARAGDRATLLAYADRPTLAAREAARAKAFWGSVLAIKAGDSDRERRLADLARRRLRSADRDSGVWPPDLTGWFGDIPVRWGGLGGYRTRRYEPVIVHYGLDRFELRDRLASSENGPVLYFRRHGLGWKLEDVRWGQQ
jgi:hypothetical protein